MGSVNPFYYNITSWKSWSIWLTAKPFRRSAGFLQSPPGVSVGEQIAVILLFFISFWNFIIKNVRDKRLKQRGPTAFDLRAILQKRDNLQTTSRLDI